MQNDGEIELDVGHQILIGAKMVEGLMGFLWHRSNTQVERNILLENDKTCDVIRERRLCG